MVLCSVVSDGFKKIKGCIFWLGDLSPLKSTLTPVQHKQRGELGV